MIFQIVLVLLFLNHASSALTMGGYALDATQPKQYNPNFIWVSKFPRVASVDYMTLEMMRNDYMDKG